MVHTKLICCPFECLWLLQTLQLYFSTVLALYFCWISLSCTDNFSGAWVVVTTHIGADCVGRSPRSRKFVGAGSPSRIVTVQRKCHEVPFLAQNIRESIWRPCFAQTRWGLQRSPKFPGRILGVCHRGRVGRGKIRDEKGEGCEMKERREGGGSGSLASPPRQ